MPDNAPNTIINNTNTPNPDTPTKTDTKLQNKNKPKYKKFNYEIAKGDYIKNELQLCDIRDRYGLKVHQYVYLCRKCSRENWHKLRSDWWQRFNSEVSDRVADDRVNWVKSLKVFVENNLQRMQSDHLPYKKTEELTNTTDTAIKLIQLLEGKSTDNISLSETKRTVSLLLSKIKR